MQSLPIHLIMTLFLMQIFPISSTYGSRRSIGDQFPDAFAASLTPKSAELVQHSGRFNGNKQAAKNFYESGMMESFQSAYDSLSDNG